MLMQTQRALNKMDFKLLRNRMVETQIASRGVKDTRVLKAMKKVPRHLFVPEHERHRSYDDNALPIGHGQTISQPYMVAIMTELLLLKGGEKLLEIGTGSGYQAAVIAEMGGNVFTIERIPELKETAKKNLETAGYRNIALRSSDGTIGWPEESPFDRIIITAASPAFPRPLLAQLADEGIGLAPVGTITSQQLLRVRKKGGKTSEQFFTPCVFVPLIGKHGWEQ